MKLKGRYLFPLLMAITFSIGKSAPSSDAFVLKVLNNYVEITSPPKINGLTSLIIENKTLAKLVGKVMEGNTVLTFMTVQKHSFGAYSFKYKEKMRYSYIPLAPGFQEIELKEGANYYAIPPQK